MLGSQVFVIQGMFLNQMSSGSLCARVIVEVFRTFSMYNLGPFYSPALTIRITI